MQMFVDIETVPNPNPSKELKAIFTARYMEAGEDFDTCFQEKAALIPEFAQIVCIGL